MDAHGRVHAQVFSQANQSSGHDPRNGGSANIDRYAVGFLMIECCQHTFTAIHGKIL
jgi:hypothetical protein